MNVDLAMFEKQGRGVKQLMCVMKRGESLSNCIKDERRPFGFDDQTLESNRPMRLSLRALVVSDRVKRQP